MKTPSNTELRKFGILFGSLVILFFGLLIPWIWDLEISLYKWPWYVGILFIIFGLLLPAILSPVFKAWMKFGHVIGWINTRILLGFMFFAIFFPMGVIMRYVFRYDPLMKKIDPDLPSYRITSGHNISSNMEKPY